MASAGPSSASGVAAPLLGRYRRKGASHHAFVGHHHSAIESLDYELVESEENAAGRGLNVAETLDYSAAKWVMVLVLGASISVVAFFINLCVENINGTNLHHTISLLSADRPILAFLLYASFATGLITASAALCAYVAPAASGSGIPEVKGFLNGVSMPAVFDVKTLGVKIVGSVCSVAGGLALGKEGPLVHIGAAMAYQMTRLTTHLVPSAARAMGLKPRFVTYLDNDRARHDFVTVGAAAGVAAAFDCPIAGVLFAVEELCSWWKKTVLWKSLFTNAVGAIVLHSLMSFCGEGGAGEGEGGQGEGRGNPMCGLYGGGGYILFRAATPIISFTLTDVAAGLGIGLLGGVLGALFNLGFLRMSALRARFITPRGPWARVAEASLIALLTASLNFSLPFFSPCTPCPPDVGCPSPDLTGNFVRYTCPVGFYSDMAGLAPVTNDNAIKNLFNNTSNVFTYQTLGVFFCVFFALAIVTHGSAVPAGLFVPHILSGAAMGRLCGKLVRALAGSNASLDEGIFALLGSAAMLGGSMRMTVCLSVMLLEVTGQLSLLPVVMFVMTVAKETGDCFNNGIVDCACEQKKLPLLEYPPPLFMKDLLAGDALQTEPVVLHGVESVARIVSVLQTTTHHAFPVLEESTGLLEHGGALFGVVHRAKLLELLRLRAFQGQPKCKARMVHSGAPHEIHTLAQEHRAARQGPHHAHAAAAQLASEDFGLEHTDLERFVDLHPYCNVSPHVVLETMSLRKAYALFRRMALRHLCVLRNRVEVVGVLTRKDLVPESFDEMTVDDEFGGVSKVTRTGTLQAWRELAADT